MDIKHQINEQIKEKEVRLINSNGEQIGIVNVSKALLMAEEEGLDLVNVSPNAKPPVCKIIDYSKFKYELSKKEKENKKKQKTIIVKEIKFSLNIDKNDLNTKINQTRKFIKSGNKVKVSLTFRGREMAYMNNNKYMLEEFAESLSDVAVVEKGIRTEGKNLVMTLVEK